MIINATEGAACLRCHYLCVNQVFIPGEVLFPWHPSWSFLGGIADLARWNGFRAHFLSLARSKLRLCSANHRAGYFSNLACDWMSIGWAYSEHETENFRSYFWQHIIVIYHDILPTVNNPADLFATRFEASLLPQHTRAAILNLL